ncbi:unnamed protein product [Caenorhabditis angaria]|uniref:Uncharacterized protein n=1 Tax=Caenorhabditis angaria TaxID=860376 RepID=A0A9P1IKD6_9PELO|nr:unnamed protein product [Caenorhabditis angaria]
MDNSADPLSTNRNRGGGGGVNANFEDESGEGNSILPKQANGEYISLTAQDLNDSEDDDDDGGDRSSMDLDFELQQLGLEPIGRP